MRTRRSWIQLASAVVVLAPSVAALAVTGPAHAATTAGFVTMTAEPHAALTGGSSRDWWAPGGGDIAVSGTTNEVVVTADGGPTEQTATFDFAAPAGKDLAARRYPDALNTATRPAGTAGIDVRTDTGGGDPGTWGSFVIRDIAFDSSGVVRRLNLVYNVHNGGENAAVFGQISINEPRPDTDALVLPTWIPFPRTYAGTESRAVRVRYVNTGSGPMRITGFVLQGRDPGQFTVARGDCVGARLVVGASCVVRTRFAPRVTRTSTALANLVERDNTDKGLHVVTLSGHLQPGHTALHLTGDSGDFVTGGHNYAYRPTNAWFVNRGSASETKFWVTSGNTTWSGWFGAETGQTLIPGDYADAAGGDDPPSGHPWIEFSGNGHGCSATVGSFHVYEYTLNPVTGVVEALSLTWTQYCDSQTDASYGSFVYHATDHAQPIPTG